MPSDSIFFHPAAGFLALAFLLPFLRGRSWRWLFFLPPAAAVVIAFTLVPGRYWIVEYLGQDLVLGRVDALTIIFVSLFAVQTLICAIFSFHVNDRAYHTAASYCAVGSIGCVMAGDYWTFFIFWEIMNLASAFLIWLNRTPRSTAAGFRYLLFLSVGTAFLFVGILLRYGSLGTFAFEQVDASMIGHYDWLILTGLCFNAAVVPLHAWVTDAYPEATVTGTVLLSALACKTAVYALARCFPGLDLLAALGTVMAVYGVIYALFENSIRRMLSYLLVSQIGFMVAGIGMGTATSINAALAQACTHTFYNGLIFMAAACLLHAAGNDELSRLGGVAKRLPLVMAGYMIAALSLSAVPFLSGFISLPMIISGAVDSDRTFIIAGLVIAALGTFFSAGLRLPYLLLMTRAPEPKILEPVPINMYAAMAVAAVLCVVQGVFPGLTYRMLPYPVQYTPYTWWKILGVFSLFGLTCLGFFLLRRVMHSRPFRHPDFDVLYRACGRGVLGYISRPLAWADLRWAEFYRVLGLRGLLKGAGRGRWFDAKGIDFVVEGTATIMLGLGKISAKLQTGRLQGQLAWMVTLALVLFGLIWFWS